MNALKILRDEAANDFPRLRGTQINATVPISASRLNQTLAASPNGLLRSLRLEIHSANQIVVRYGVVHATAVLEEAIDFAGSPALTLRLHSVLIASILRSAVRVPFVRFHGTSVRIDLGGIPYIQENRRFWKHIKAVGLKTTAGRLEIRIEIAIDGLSEGAIK